MLGKKDWGRQTDFRTSTKSIRDTLSWTFLEFVRKGHSERLSAAIPKMDTAKELLRSLMDVKGRVLRAHTGEL